MHRVFSATVVWFLFSITAVAQVPLAPAEIAIREHEALLALDRFMETWNTRDLALWATSLHYPHVRPGPGPFELFMSREDYIKSVNFEATLATGWRYSRWETRRVLQLGIDKVHVAGHWKRHAEDGHVIGENLVSYVITHHDDGWRVQARFAAGSPARQPEIIAKNAAAALESVHAFHDAINSHDPDRLAASIHYPHVRLGGGIVSFWLSPTDFFKGTEPGRQRTWAETRLERAEVIQVGESRANVALLYSRRNATGDVLSQYEAIELAVNRDGQWKVQAQSVLGP